MVTYEVTTTVDPRLVEAYERFMRQVHIPDLLATGCFHGAALDQEKRWVLEELAQFL